ncbi:hypothetical protein TNCV_4272731 [Trichonephila clavipes]|nr:hypothetical protein TNCV_4272731 [Trichonephila clavipes]
MRSCRRRRYVDSEKKMSFEQKWSCFSKGNEFEIVRLLNVPRQTVSDATCRFKELAMMVSVQEVGEKAPLKLEWNVSPSKSEPREIRGFP